MVYMYLLIVGVEYLVDVDVPPRYRCTSQVQLYLVR
jgi:hypothetical protein